MFSTSVEAFAAKSRDESAVGSSRFAAYSTVRDVFHTTTTLASVVVVQLAIILIRASLSTPLARLLSVVSTILLSQILLSASSISMTMGPRPLGKEA